MAFAAHVVSWFSFHTRSSLPFPLLGSAPLPINEVHQGSFGRVRSAINKARAYVLGIGCEVYTFHVACTEYFYSTVPS
ncbi:hypothetical protein BGY98DRAFT_103754 [Russula aff. rugulosa BPL654]|nr:hypothetical protein BGY98DRAFT_103754 [Russula aff. rugulosa BPL654]